jgi:hypothetical protein
MAELGTIDLSTILVLLASAGFCYSAWLTSIARSEAKQPVLPIEASR